MATTLNEQVRIRVVDYMAAAGLRLGKDGSHVVRQLVGTPESGVQASLRMDDDVIEFGLLSRNGDEAVNVLNASVIVDDGEASIYCVSATDGRMNFSMPVSGDNGADGLFVAADFMAEFITHVATDEGVAASA